MSTETLYDCHGCGRKNFTARGLKAHVCRPDKNILPFPSMQKETTHQLVPVISSFTELELTGTPTGGADAAIGAKLTELYNEAQAAELAILRFGAAFWAVEQGVLATCGQNSPKSGPGAYGFISWMRDHAPEVAITTARRYRDIAEKTAEKFKISDPVRVFSLPASELDQDDQDKRAAVVDFIANKSMRGLQLELGIGGRGGSTTRGRSDGQESKPTVKSDEPPSWCNEIQKRVWATLTEDQRNSYCEWMPRIYMMSSQVADPKKGFLPNLPQIAKDDLVTVCIELLVFLRPGVLRTSQIPTA